MANQDRKALRLSPCGGENLSEKELYVSFKHPNTAVPKI